MSTAEKVNQRLYIKTSSSRSLPWGISDPAGLQKELPVNYPSGHTVISFDKSRAGGTQQHRATLGPVGHASSRMPMQSAGLHATWGTTSIRIDTSSVFADSVATLPTHTEDTPNTKDTQYSIQ